MEETFLYSEIRVENPLSKYNNILNYKHMKGPSNSYFYINKCEGGNTSGTPTSFFISLKWMVTDWAVFLANNRRAANRQAVSFCSVP